MNFGLFTVSLRVLSVGEYDIQRACLFGSVAEVLRVKCSILRVQLKLLDISQFSF